jgi:hypothetical protein
VGIYDAVSNRPGLGTKLAEEMIKLHRPTEIDAGEVTPSGNGLAKSIARRHPEIAVRRTDDEAGIYNRRYSAKALFNDRRGDH